MKEKMLIALMLVVFAITRIPGLMPLNFSAGYALALCAGIYFPGRQKWLLPLGTMLVTDVFLNVFCYMRGPINEYMVVNYGVYAILIAMGRRIGSRAAFWKMILGGLLGSVLFYLVTNTFSWIQNPEYQKTLLGWIQSLTVGTPGHPPTWEFFRNTLLSGGLFTALFAGTMKLGEAPEAETEEAAEEAPAEPETGEEAKA